MFSLHHTRRLLADLTVGTRLGMGFGALIALMLVLTLFGVYALQDSSVQVAQLGTVSAVQIAQLQSQQQQWIVLLGSLGALALLGGSVIAWALVDSVKWPLDRAVDMAERLADGEDHHPADAHQQDEFGHLLRAMTDIRRRLQSATQDAAQATAQAMPAQTDEPVDERAPVVAVPTLSDGDQPLQVSVRTAQEMLSVAVTAAQRGGEVVSQVVANMDDIRAASREIFEIIGKIDNIAFQTNLLALHAAVEAAQAGEKGKGFAQVAGEVRALAVRAANAAKEIKTLVHASAEKVEFGGQLARDADLTMDAIIVSVQRMTDLVEHRRQNPQLGGPQAAQPEQDVLLLDRLNASNATMVAESASTAEALRLQAERLQKVVSAFQMLQQTQEAAWNAHHAIASARQRAKGQQVTPMPPFPSSDWGTLDENRQAAARLRRRSDDRGDGNGSGGDSTTY
ncbi:HAMP domain-containing protein [Sphaerotilus montanus]|jgi:methyl-accepting chemotaxis protein|uniref:Methyl-accepting chemotaxis protein n=1 Tax=Sphaerotilus montanus TaxID=522889 RepID=A0A7Y9UD61_9BURK|nr:methyl-accepting chemotaxis protein [Sphaerotilus montanus]NYG34274.1 methyl-accepting chemotaxis protein [Sphaerotilus montanus]NZD58999.1 HAMP domain-containing protein [Sphaerotilus montanus]